jgi:hypothetical protein
MYGHFYLSVGGIILGSPDEMETLNAILACSRDWKALTNTNCSELLFLANTVHAFLSVESALYGLHHWTSLIPEGFKEIPFETSFHCQFDAGESSDAYRLYVLAYNGSVRLIYSDLVSEPGELVISKIEFDSEVDAATKGLDEDFKALKDRSER